MACQRPVGTGGQDTGRAGAPGATQTEVEGKSGVLGGVGVRRSTKRGMENGGGLGVEDWERGFVYWTGSSTFYT